MASDPAIDRPLTADDCISMNRFNLRVFCEKFQTAVDLFTLLERGGGPPNVGILGGVFIQYRIIASHEAALNAYHFKCSLEAVINLLPKSHDSKIYVNVADIQSALSTFKDSFPHTDNIRHAIAHAGELYNSVPKFKTSHQRNDVTFQGGSSGKGGIFGVALFERTFTVGKAGSIFSLLVDNSSTIKLDNIIKLVDSAFRAYDEQAQQPS